MGPMRMEKWREDAINWIHQHVSDLPETPQSKWHVGKPSLMAQTNALHVIRDLPPDFRPLSHFAVTLEGGLALEWRNGEKELTITILADGSVEALKCVSDEVVEEQVYPTPNWKLGSWFDWLAS